MSLRGRIGCRLVTGTITVLCLQATQVVRKEAPLTTKKRRSTTKHYSHLPPHPRQPRGGLLFFGPGYSILKGVPGLRILI
ncbi:hypothetical protein L207DRAFT_520099 [Hyaloscypha variabilis F]|uniref:Secreted protein n=1 Tax=Hyaloscypha variabilis (strain UAMH 11265 / GT02V1 / F) TaxID=1149755 RepID=A0A2J6QWF8_HYAVF|nr:hypothetical protein L207DRAFT_520099 [Hyaloscypha variabilis F]